MYQYMGIVNEINIELSKYLENPHFYIPKINRFFESYMALNMNSSRPLDSITYHDINSYLCLENVVKDYANQYYGLKKFFDYTYRKNKTQDIMSKVIAPRSLCKIPSDYIPEEHIINMDRFIADSKEPILDRILIGLFLYTGLSRKYIWSIKNNDLYVDGDVVSIQFMEQGVVIPIADKLSKILIEYKRQIKVVSMFDQIFAFKRGEDVNPTLNKITKQITGVKYTPTIFSNTFIKKCLSVSNDIDSISKLVLENPVTIMKHVEIESEDTYHNQSCIVKSICY